MELENLNAEDINTDQVIYLYMYVNGLLTFGIVLITYLYIKLENNYNSLIVAIIDKQNNNIGYINGIYYNDEILDDDDLSDDDYEEETSDEDDEDTSDDEEETSEDEDETSDDDEETSNEDDEETKEEDLSDKSDDGIIINLEKMADVALESRVDCTIM